MDYRDVGRGAGSAVRKIYCTGPWKLGHPWELMDIKLQIYL
jgi:hypothetical protein